MSGVLPPPRVLYTDANGGQILGYTEIDMLDAMAGSLRPQPVPMELSVSEAQCLAAIIEHGTAKKAGRALRKPDQTVEGILKRIRQRTGHSTTLQLCVAFARWRKHA